MLFKIKEYLFYLIRCINFKRNNNTFLIQFKKEVLFKKVSLRNIKKLRDFYKCNTEKIAIEDYGAGSKTIKTKDFIASKNLYFNVGISEKHGELLYKIVDFLNIENVLELGTSLGLSAAYLSKASVTSIEGNKDLANKTSKHLKNFGFDSVEVINNKFDEVLDSLLIENSYELIFIDGNHTEEATLFYFNLCLKYNKEKIVIIFDDIYWSNGMKNAWLSIKEDKAVKLSVDLFKFGFVFIDSEIIEKEDVTIWY